MTTGGLPQIGFQAVVQGLASFVSGANTVNRITQDLNASVQKLGFESTAGFNRFSTAATLAFAGIVGLATTAATALSTVAVVSGKVAADFENSMVQIQVFAHGTAEEMRALDDALFNIGRTTPVSMQQAAEGMVELAKGGITVKQALGGVLKAVVDFKIASAGNLGMADAALAVAKAMTTFHLAASEATRATDSLTNAAQGTVLSYTDLNRSFQQVAGVAFDVGLTIEDTAATLGVLAQAGLRGSDAGTSLKQMFIALSNPSKEAIDKMREYNISLFDGEQKAKNIEVVIAELQKAFGEQAIATGRLTVLQKENALGTIFGSDAIRASSALARQGAQAFRELRDTGVKAADIASIFLKPTSVQLTILKNGVFAVAEVFGKAFLESIRGALLQVNLFLLSISKADIENFANNVASLAKGAVVAAVGFFEFSKSVALFFLSLTENRAVMLGLTVALAAITAPAVTTGLAALGSGFLFLVDGIVAVAIALGEVGIALFGGGGVTVALAILGRSLLALISPMTIFLTLLFILGTNAFGARDALVQLAGILGGGFILALSKANKAIADFGADVLDVIADIIGGMADFADNTVIFSGVVADTLRGASQKVRGMSGDMRQLGEESEQRGNQAAAGVFEFTNSLVSGKSTIDDIIAKVKEFTDALFKPSAGGGKNIFDEIEEFNQKTSAAAKAQLEELINLLGSSFPAGTEKAKSFLEALGVTVDQTRKFFEALGFSVGDTARFMKLLGITAAEASPIIGDLGLTIAQGIVVLLKLGFSIEEATAMVTALAESLKKTKTAFEETGASISGATKLLEAMGLSTDDIVAKLTGLGVDALDAAGGLSEIGLDAATATKFLVALGFSTEEARAKLKDLSDEALKRSAFEKLKKDVEALAATIRTDLSSALGVLNAAFGGGTAAGVVTAGRAVATGALEQLTTQLAKLGQFGSAIAGILGDFFTDITTDILDFSTATGTATSAIEAFAAAATTLPLNAAASIGLMTNAADSLERTMQSLSGTELLQAEAVLKVLRGLIEQAVAAGTDADALGAVKTAFDLLGPTLDKIAGNIDTATAAAKKLRASLSISGFDMASIMEAANSAVETFKIQLEQGLVPGILRADTAMNRFNDELRANEVATANAVANALGLDNALVNTYEQARLATEAFINLGNAQKEALLSQKQLEARNLVALAFSAQTHPDVLSETGPLSTAGGILEQAITVLGGGFRAAAEVQKLVEEFINNQKQQQEFVKSLPDVFKGIFTQFGFQHGGIVPGPTGRAVPAMVHGGEFIFTPTQVQRLEVSIPRNMVAELATALRGSNNSYVVNASYENVQSPLSIEADLRAMVAITR